MPAYNFKEEFANIVQRGFKNQTIRSRRKRPTVVGDVLYLYTGMRTKKCRKLCEAECTKVTPVVIAERKLIVNGEEVTGEALERMRYDDGFNSVDEFFDFFEEAYGKEPLTDMELIQWH